jgi:hypothetical protein
MANFSSFARWSSVILERSEGSTWSDFCARSSLPIILCQATFEAQVFPARISTFDELNLPAAQPALDFLLTRNRLSDIFDLLEVNQSMNLVLACESRRLAAAMLVNAPQDIVCHTDIERRRFLPCRVADRPRNCSG